MKEKQNIARVMRKYAEDIRIAKAKRRPPMAPYCEMCGAHETPLERALNPDGELKTLCQPCREGSALVIADKVAAIVKSMLEEDRK